MSALVASPFVAASPTLGLDKLLVHMAHYGKPHLFIGSSGWFCSVAMNTNTTGTSFEVKSDHGMPDPFAAATQCNQRIEAALRQLTGAAK